VLLSSLGLGMGFGESLCLRRCVNFSLPRDPETYRRARPIFQQVAA
jgi:hypothetical protein